MQAYSGQVVQGGAAYGFVMAAEYFEQRVKVSHEDRQKKKETKNAEDTIGNFLQARVYVDRQLCRLEETTRASVSEKAAAIFSACRMLLMDATISNMVIEAIGEGKTQEEAVEYAFGYLVNMLEQNNSELFKSRSEDVNDLKLMLIEAMRTDCKGTPVKSFKGKCILVADNITAAQMMKYDIRSITGIVLRKGSPYSHAAILAKAKNIPMIIGCNIPANMTIAGFPAVLFADEGRFFINPTEEISAEYKSLKLKHVNLAQDIARMKQSGINPLGQYANAYSLDCVRNAKKAGTLGVGLYRTEFIYLEDNTPPTEEKQYEVYSQAAKILEGLPIIFRTADFDEDKMPSYIKSENGMRGISYSLAEQNLLRTQLKALLRASVHGNIGILLPMVKSPDEVDDTLCLIEDIKRELAVEGHNFAKAIPVGVMIETPEAVECVDSLAEMAAFFSIGTNDLTRYALGLDRATPSDIDGENREKLLNMVETVTTAAHKAGIKAMICGELGSNPEWHMDFLKAKVDGFSVTI